ncbi:hypothetical protein Zm00014a_014215 [Zea mays]|uniref:cellulase n=1 Tax=Zea mays TaxID=4577 RepID=A0A3L6F5X3_MAIZE|nr:Endoglucanase 7 [Zea mays]PWZ27701.1 hypothetical protein Zm00014a_014215 [Zea mays]
MSSAASSPCHRLRRVALLLLVAAVLAEGKAHDYGDALRKSLLYFEAQRSGRLPHSQRVAWRHHSGLTDGLEQGVDLVGGYYDAGDHVKFGLPMAFTVTMLSWSLIEYGGDVADAGELGHALEAVKWGTDYFIKAHTRPDELWAEVGDGDTDHYCWQRPEDMTTSRQAYKVDRDTGLRRRRRDRGGHGGRVHHLPRLQPALRAPPPAPRPAGAFGSCSSFADKYRGTYDSSIAEVKSYYASVSGYKDELLWAALWLHRATGRDDYLDYVVDNADSFGGTGWAINEFSWDVKYAGVQILAARGQGGAYVCACLGRNTEGGADANVERSPGGIALRPAVEQHEYVTGAALLLSAYSDYLAAAEAGGAARAVSCAAAAERYPGRVHHRAASIVPYKHSREFIGCTQGFDHWFGRRGSNPNLLVGAIVGGPDRRDRFRDSRDNYMQTEACTYNTAPMVGVFAKLRRMAWLEREQGSTSVPVTVTSTAAEV